MSIFSNSSFSPSLRIESLVFLRQTKQVYRYLPFVPCFFIRLKKMKISSNFLWSLQNPAWAGHKIFASGSLVMSLLYNIVLSNLPKPLAVYIEISLVSWNLPNDPKCRDLILRNMCSPEEDQLLGGAFNAIVDKIEADIIQIPKKWNWK